MPTEISAKVKALHLAIFGGHRDDAAWIASDLAAAAYYLPQPVSLPEPMEARA